MNKCSSVIVGFGHYLPERVVPNQEFEEFLDTNHQWIVERTGIHKRHFAAPGELTSDLATKAARSALMQANLQADDIDLIVVATCTPDETLPPTATKVQANLGNTSGFAFDVNGVCSGFLTALATANNFLCQNQAQTALVIGAETFSRILDMTDRSTCILFGDGAGAIVLQAVPETSRGVLKVTLQSDGSYHDILYTDGGPSSTGTSGKIRMVGREVYRHAVGKQTESALKILKDLNLTTKDIDWLVPHQANIRIIQSVGQRLGLPEHKIVTTVGQQANTSAATIPLALSQAANENCFKEGDLILHAAAGAGLMWGSALVRW
ncbi:MAG: beta-ketoacyl-ACP synthase III [Pseudomonadota bacterium]